MFSFLAVFFTIVGSILGCGFFSGKEIVVFFSRFGYWSFLSIFFLFFVFYFFFRFLLNLDFSIIKKVQHSKFFLVSNIFVCLVFSSAMFACLSESLIDEGLFLKIFLIGIVLLCCILILFKGGNFLSKINIFLVPFMIFVFIFILFCNIEFKFPIISNPSFPLVSLFYSFLYCALNTANSSLVIAHLGKNLSQKQKARVAFLSAFVLMIILFFANIILLQNQDSFGFEMPFMSILSIWQKVVLKINIFLGAMTTLFSLTYNFHISLKGVCNNFLLIFLSVVLPFIFSFLGFGNIVSFLYPIASVLSFFMLFALSFEKYNIFNFKFKNYKKKE